MLYTYCKYIYIHFCPIDKPPTPAKIIECHHLPQHRANGNRWRQRQGRHGGNGPSAGGWLVQLHSQHEFQVPKIKVLNLIRLYWGWGFPYIALTYSLYKCVPPFLGTWNVWWYNIYTSTQGMREVALAPPGELRTTPRCCAHGGRGCEDNKTLKLAREVMWGLLHSGKLI